MNEFRRHFLWNERASLPRPAPSLQALLNREHDLDAELAELLRVDGDAERDSITRADDE